MKEQFDNYKKYRDILLAEKAAMNLSALSQEIVAKLHSEVFKHAYTTPCRSCGKIWLGYMDDLDKWYIGNIPVFEDEAIEPPPPKKAGKPMSEEAKAKMLKTRAENKAKKLRDTKIN